MNFFKVVEKIAARLAKEKKKIFFVRIMQKEKGTGTSVKSTNITVIYFHFGKHKVR